MSSCSSVDTITIRDVHSSPRTRDFWEVCQPEETPFPSVLVRAQETPDLWSAPIQDITILERALNSLPLVSSDALTLLVQYRYIRELCSHNCANVLRKRIAQSQDWLCNLDIVQIPRLHGSYPVSYCVSCELVCINWNEP